MNKKQIAMMDHLTLFNEVLNRGTKLDSSYELDGVTAWHDLDGYTCYLGYKDLTLTLLFHGKVALEYEHKETRADFDNKIRAILAAKAH
jgi:hypothetical protein